MVFETICAFFATVSFSVIFNTPKKYLLFCGLNGSISWFAYSLVNILGFSASTSTFVATLIVTYVARVLASVRKAPISIFLLAGIICLVPGAGMYYIMFNFINSNYSEMTLKFFETLKMAIFIPLGIIIILSLPKNLFYFKINKSN